MSHPNLIAWEKKLRQIFFDIDHFLEEKYKGAYPLRNNRPVAGATANPEFDGLFNVGAAFTAGYGSKHGRGYVVQINIATFSQVSAAFQSTIESEIKNLLVDKLARVFPGQDLRVEKDGSTLKVCGDLSLGSL